MAVPGNIAGDRLRPATTFHRFRRCPYTHMFKGLCGRLHAALVGTGMQGGHCPYYKKPQGKAKRKGHFYELVNHETVILR